MSEMIDYGKLMQRAMRSLIKDVLSDVAKNGLPGEHHFFITFDTNHPDVQIADWLKGRYPEEMTVVLQHWFDHLVVTDEGFSVVLNFGDNPEPIAIPYAAIQTFVDPSVEFGLRFDQDDDEDFDDEEEDEEAPMAEMVAEDEVAAEKPAGAEIVSLDKFRR